MGLWTGKAIKLSSQTPIERQLDLCNRYTIELFLKLFDNSLSKEQLQEVRDRLVLVEFEYRAVISLYDAEA